MRIYFVRHGKTEWNLEGRYQGAGGDSPLLPESYTEMKALAHYYRDIPFAHIYSSPIKRARVTAETINRNLTSHPGVICVDRLKEFNLGKMEGMKFTDVKKKFPHEYIAFRYHPDQYRAAVVGGESFQQVINRMTPAIQKIARENPGKNVVVVSHGAALNAEVNSLLGTPISHLRDRGGLANTSTTVLETKDNGQHFTLVDWNNTKYLTRKLKPSDLI